MANVTLKNIKKVYNKQVTAVHDFNLEIKDKEFIVLVGPSGCGKTTTLRMVAGLEDITAGELYIGDTLVNDIAPKDRDIAMVFQSYALYPHMSVQENMAFSLTLKKENTNTIKEKVEHAASILGITNLLNRKPKALSGGQRQRVAIGRAIVRNPKVFLLDEPLSNLDAKLRNQMRAELIKLRERIDTTFIYVTHDQVEAMTLGDRIVVMNDGEIQQIGTPQEVFEQPRNVFVATFIGSPQMNLFHACLKREGAHYVIEYGGKTISLPKEKEEKLWENQIDSQEIIFGIRSEHIKMCEPEDEIHITAKVEVAEMMGSSVHLHVKVGENDVVIIVQTIDLTPENRERIKSKGEVDFSFNKQTIHIFDKETKVNIGV